MGRHGSLSMDKGKKHKAQENEKTGADAGCERVCGEELQERPEAAQKAAAEGLTSPAPKEQPQDYYAQLVQLKADFENYRKRMEKERPCLISWGRSEAILSFLPLYDLLLSAHQHMDKLKEGSDAKQAREVIKGFEMIFKEFSKIFEAEGIRPMEPVGKPYDPMANEILCVVDGDDSNDGLVNEELQKGFYCGDKVLRPAKVKIAKKKAQPPAEGSGDNAK